MMSLDFHSIVTDQMDWITQWTDIMKSLPPLLALPPTTKPDATATATATATTTDSTTAAVVSPPPADEWNSRSAYLLSHSEAVELMTKTAKKFAVHKQRVRERQPGDPSLKDFAEGRT